MKTIIVTTLLAATCMTAEAQIGKVLNKVIKQTEKVVNNAVDKVTEGADRIANVTEKEVRDVLHDEDSLIYGDHRYSMQGNIAADKYRRNGFGNVTFTHVPSDFEEFKAVYTTFLGKTAFGAAAMMDGIHAISLSAIVTYGGFLLWQLPVIWDLQAGPDLIPGDSK